MNFPVFDISTAQIFFSLLRERFMKEEGSLNALDAASGDGDHGSTVQRGFCAAQAAARGPQADLGSLFERVSQAIAESSGGAIGPLLAAFFSAGTVFGNKSEAGKEDLVHFLSEALEAVQQVGGAKAGDKTMIDALAPAVQVFSQGTDLSLSQAFRRASQAAWEGVRSTRRMQAVHGRARFLAGRSLGHQDPGATSMAMILDAFSDALAGNRPAPFATGSETGFVPPPGKLINSPDSMVAQDNQGLALAYPRLVRLEQDGVLVRCQPKAAGKPGLAIGHGGGHTPSMGGFVGPGLLDADVYGPLFTCASGIRIARAIELADRGAGVALLVSNHSGDVMNARLAVRRAREKGIQVEAVLLGDDISTAPRQRLEARRGLGGLLFALKTGGAAAEAGRNLQEVVRLMQRTNERTATLSVAIRPASHPVTGLPLFELPAGQIEVGTGVHGELGVYRGKHLPADELADMLSDRLAQDLEPFGGRRILAFVNGAGGTSLMELHIIYRRLHENLVGRGFQVEAGVVDSFFTTQDMGGFSISLCVADEEILEAWNAPAQGASFHWPYYEE
jgi:phosphoenolpyruvate---glycerone phosphotransferase subunit DhaK